MPGIVILCIKCTIILSWQALLAWQGVADVARVPLCDAAFLQACYGQQRRERTAVHNGSSACRLATAAAGELSPAAAWALCFALAAGGLALTAANFGSAITSLYALGLLLGTAYSVPPLRLKRFEIPAFLIIATVRPSRSRARCLPLRLRVM